MVSFLRLLAFLLQLVHAQYLVNLHIQPRPWFTCGLVCPYLRRQVPRECHAIAVREESTHETEKTVRIN